MTRSSGLQIVVLLVMTGVAVTPGEAVAVPLRRLVRRGIIVSARPEPAAVATPAPAATTPPPTRAALPAPARASALAPAPTRAQAPAAAPAAVTPRPAAIEPARVPAPSANGQAAAAGVKPVRVDATVFTPDWRARHPQAWRPAGPALDWWRAADERSVVAWLSQPVVAGGGVGEETVQTAAAEAGVGADGLQSVLVLPAGHANQTAKQADSDWLSLGAFAILAPGSDQPHDYQQLAVDRSGAIKGTFYDPVSDTTQPIAGTVDRSTLVASWTVGAGGSRFSAAVRDLTTPPRTVAVSAGGQTRSLELMPVPRP